MDWARQRNLCRMIVINRSTWENLNLPALLAQVQGGLRRRMPADQFALRARRPRVIDCFAEDHGQADFLSVGDVHRARDGNRWSRSTREAMTALPGAGQCGSGHAARAAGEGAARGPSGAGVAYLGAQRGRGARPAGVLWCATCRIRARATRRCFFAGAGPDARSFRSEPDPSRHVLAHVFKDRQRSVHRPHRHVSAVHQGTITRDTQLYVGEGKKAFKGRPPAAG